MRYTLVILRSHGQKVPVSVWPARLAHATRLRSQGEILVFCFVLFFRVALEEYYVAHAGLELPCLCLLSAMHHHTWFLLLNSEHIVSHLVPVRL